MESSLNLQGMPERNLSECSAGLPDPGGEAGDQVQGAVVLPPLRGDPAGADTVLGRGGGGARLAAGPGGTPQAHRYLFRLLPSALAMQLAGFPVISVCAQCSVLSDQCLCSVISVCAQ